MRKIVLVGCAGSGKSTLARQLGALLDIEVVHLDALYWKSNWTKTPEDEWQEALKVLIKKDSWILDGNFSSSRKLRFEAADTIIFLDFPRHLCLLRVVKRYLQFRAKSRPDRAEGCREQLSSYLIKHVWTFPTRLRPSLIEDTKKYADSRNVIVLSNLTDVSRFLAQLQSPLPPQ